MGKRDKRKKSREQQGAKAKRPTHDDFQIEEDIDKILEDYAQDLANKSLSSDADSDGPSPRANSSLVSNPMNSSEAILFGGEYSDGERMLYYPDLFKYNLDKNTWKRYNCPVAPKPRSSHQMASCSNGKLLLFGGEFGTTNDTKFLHHRDCWLLDPKGMTWEKVEGRCPPPRSGHRMVSWRNLVVLFGGFFDDGKTTRYLDDLWIFDCKEASWSQVNLKGERPGARSGFVFGACEAGAVMFGGYYMSKDSKGHCTGKSLSDLWVLNIAKSAEDIQLTWARHSIPIPFFPRSGMSSCVVKNSLVIFGGVVDEDMGDEYIHGTCQTGVYLLDLAKLSAWNELDIKGTQPHGRFNSMMISSGKIALIIGGIVEVGDSDVFLDDIWSLHFGTSPHWSCARSATVAIPEPVPDDMSSCSSDAESTGDSSDEDDDSGSDSSDAESFLSDCSLLGPKVLKSETLREYYQRNQSVFIGRVMHDGSIKEDKCAKKHAFSLAEELYHKLKDL